MRDSALGGIPTCSAPGPTAKQAAIPREASSPSVLLIDSDSTLSDPGSADPLDALGATHPTKANIAKSKLVEGKSETVKGIPKQKAVVTATHFGDGTIFVTPMKGVKAKAKGDLAKMSKAKPVKTSTGKQKTTIDTLMKKADARPVKKPEIVVEPPIFEKVDTRLGREEAEQRISVCLMLRMRSVLSDPSYANISSASDPCCRFLSGHWELWTILIVL